MGADIYLDSVMFRTRKKYRPKIDELVRIREGQPDSFMKDQVQDKISKYYELMYPDTGYFRDPYNLNSVAWALGFSWWKCVVPKLVRGYLPIKDAKRLLKKIEDRPWNLEVVEKYINKTNNENRADNFVGSETPQQWFTYWSKRREHLIKILTTSITRKEPLRCSL